ncbi:SDR family oxidoreductase [Paenibacillus eucommiae]|uniref:NAD(P)-dependent dehydrogenase (Short-subunit alcohol dehydrogenase family) n=1 Tax=Paenibacillus eucommiae TaxID=1355755 RepID=A0ABS4IWC8_9BACL|nr:SDR family oxidoreductase [Paenibacillus eucommiae]MBP1991895.1 NAD(P)-dependent dehydrogenase (short-subunit alcohol dehydrogenase family) [Paenibacillus eucommiae]
MKEKICMVTGANKGMGKAAALEFAKQGATVIMVCRNPQLGKVAQDEIKRLSGSKTVELFIADLSSQQSVRKFVEQFQSKHSKLHVLFNNAGGLFTENHILSVDNIEMNLGVNYFSTFLLTNLLLDRLIASGSGRIIHTSSMMMAKSLNWDAFTGKQTLSPMKMYGLSKLAIVLYTYKLARKLAGTGVTVNALHPGFVHTDNATNSFPKMLRPLMTIFKPFVLTPEQGSQTALYLASSPEVEGITGKYFVKKKEKSSVPISYDEALQERVWTYSAELTGSE